MSYRIIQWSSGNVGKHAITTIAGREGMELAALYVYSEEKSGVDAGYDRRHRDSWHNGYR